MNWGRFRKGRNGTRSGVSAAGRRRAAGGWEASDEAFEACLRLNGFSITQHSDLADSLKERWAQLGPDPGAALIEGAALALKIKTGSGGAGSRGAVVELVEVERLMGAFSGELAKLDEVLEVLAAYVRRMRSTNADEVERTIH
jgi:hypothetical protein